MNRCIIFDLDGTLIDSRADLTTAVNLMRKHFSLPPLTLDAVTSYVGNGARKLTERALAETGVDVDDALHLMKKFYLEHLVDKTTLYPGVLDGLKKLSGAGWKLALITNKPDGPCHEILKHFAIDNLFAVVIGGDCKFPLKPDPASIFHILEVCGASPSRSLILGDNYTDLESGRRAGIKCCFASYGFGRKNGLPSDMEVASFPEFTEKMISC